MEAQNYPIVLQETPKGKLMVLEPGAKPFFFHTITKDESVQTIRARHDSKEWKQDPLGYFLIKVDYGQKRIHVAFCTNDHVIRKEIVGKNAEEIYYTIIRNNLVSRLQHTAYLGRELQKAETALALNIKYVQCSPLDHNAKI